MRHEWVAPGGADPRISWLVRRERVTARGLLSIERSKRKTVERAITPVELWIELADEHRLYAVCSNEMHADQDPPRERLLDEFHDLMTRLREAEERQRA